MKHICPVCGFNALDFDPYYFPCQEICPSCSFQFGKTDNDEGYTHEQWRNEWIKKGMVWWSSSNKKPANWDPKRQLLNIGIKI